MQTPDSADDITLAHLTDPHLLADPNATLQGINTHKNLLGVLDHMREHSRKPALLLATGDLTHDGSPQAYARFLRAGSTPASWPCSTRWHRKTTRAMLWGHVHQAYDATLPLAQGTPGRELRMLATPATSFQFGPGSQDFSLDAAAPGYRWITLHASGDISTDVVRVPGLIQTPGT